MTIREQRALENLLMTLALELFEFKMSIEQIAQRVNRSALWVMETVYLSERLHQTIRLMMRRGLLSRVICLQYASLNEMKQLEVVQEVKRRLMEEQP